MADTVYHSIPPYNGGGTQTVQHLRTDHVLQAESLYEPPPIDWARIDQLITLMAYVVLDRMLRHYPDDSSLGEGINTMDQDIRFQIIERLRLLIELFKTPV